MEVKQINSIVNNIANQSYGKNAVQITDLTGLISYGKKVLSTDKDKELFVKSLADIIIQTEIQNKEYSPSTRRMLRNVHEYGAAVQKVYIAPETASENDAWNITEGGALGPGTIHLPTVEAKIFESRGTWKYTVCIPDYQMNSAFTSYDGVAAFISAVYTSIKTSMAVAIENLVNLAQANYMGELFIKEKELKKGTRAVNLLKAYNTIANASLTRDNCLRDAAFLKYAGKEIKKRLEQMEKTNVIFNNDGKVRFTNKEDINVLFLSEYAAANETYLESDTYHNELIKLPGYTSVPYWQGLGTDGGVDNTSKIHITTSSGTTVEQVGIIGLVYDTEAMGVLFDHRKSTSYVDPDKDITKIWTKATTGYFNDLGEQAILFYVADDAEDFVTKQA